MFTFAPKQPLTASRRIKKIKNYKARLEEEYNVDKSNKQYFPFKQQTSIYTVWHSKTVKK